MFEFFRVIDATHDDPTFVPCLSAPDAAFPFEWEPADGGEPEVFTTKAAAVSQYSGRGWTEIKRLKDITLTVVITDARVVVYCEKFTKGGGWFGFGVGGLAVALVANAVSHAKAASRRRGKLLVAQARYPWLSAVGVPTDKRGRQYALRLVVDAGTSTEARTLALDLFLKERDRPDAWAAAVASRAARFRLATGSPDAVDRAPLQQIATGSAAGPFDLAASVRVGTTASAAPVAGSRPAASPPEVVAEHLVAQPAIETLDPLPDAARAGCAACGASLTPGMPTCGRCGSAVRQSAPASVPDVRQTATPLAGGGDVAATTRRSALTALLPAAASASGRLEPTQANAGRPAGFEDTQVVPDFRPAMPNHFGSPAVAPEASVNTASTPMPPAPAFGMTPRAPAPAPPEVWLVSGGLLLLSALFLYPVLKYAGPLIPDLFGGSQFTRALAALFLEFVVILVACGAALLLLAVGLVRGSRVAQVLTCVLGALVSLGEVIGAQDHKFGTPSVSTGVAVACVLITLAIMGLLTGSERARTFFAGDRRPAGVVIAATANLYLGGVAILDGLLLLLAGSISHRLIWYGIGFAAVGLMLVAANALLRRGSQGARAVSIAGYGVFVVVVLIFANKYDELSAPSTLEPIGLVVAAAVGLLMPPRSQAHFASGASDWAPPTGRSPGLFVGLAVLLVAVLGAASIGLSTHDDRQASADQPDYSYSTESVIPVAASSGIDQSDAQSLATTTMDALEGNGSTDVCGGEDLPKIDVYDYRIGNISPETSGTFKVSATVGLNDGTYETVSYLVTDDGAGSPCVEADSFDTASYTPNSGANGTQPEVPTVTPNDVPSVPSSDDPVPTDAPLPTTPTGAVVPFDSDTTPMTTSEIVQYQAGGLDTDQTDAVSSVIGFMTYINQQNFQSAWNRTTYLLRNGVPTASFKHGYATSRFYQAEFGEPKELAGDLVVVPARFVSRQDPGAQGDPNGVTTCSYWPQYMFTVVDIDGQWLVDTSGAYSSRPELAPLKRAGTDGVYLNPQDQREDCS